MPASHLLFIPAVFLTGALTGFVAATHRADAGPGGVRPVSLAAAFAGFLVTLVATHAAPIPGGVRSVHASVGHGALFDQQPAFDPLEVYRRIEGFGEVGRAAYQQFTYTTDLVFPLAMFGFLVVLGRFVAGRVAPGPVGGRVVAAAPVLWLAADLVENGLVFTLLAAYPEPHLVAAGLLPYVTVAKFALLLAAFVGPLALYAARGAAVRP